MDKVDEMLTFIGIGQFGFWHQLFGQIWQTFLKASWLQREKCSILNS